MPHNTRTKIQMGAAVEKLISAWLNYARAYKDYHDQPIGDDGYAESEWTDIGKAIIELLNFETGDLDRAHISSYIKQVATRNAAYIP